MKIFIENKTIYLVIYFDRVFYNLRHFYTKV